MNIRIARKLKPWKEWEYEISGTDCPAAICSLCLKQTPEFGRYCMNCGALLVEEGARGRSFQDVRMDYYD